MSKAGKKKYSLQEIEHGELMHVSKKKVPFKIIRGWDLKAGWKSGALNVFYARMRWFSRSPRPDSVFHAKQNILSGILLSETNMRTQYTTRCGIN